MWSIAWNNITMRGKLLKTLATAHTFAYIHEANKRWDGVEHTKIKSESKYTHIVKNE